MLKIKLTEPIKIDGILVHELTLRHPKVKDRLAVERMGTNDAEKEVALIANLAGVAREAIEELSLVDYNKAQEALKDFLSQSMQPT